MKLNLTPVRVQDVLDDATLVDYSTTKGLNTLRLNRAMFEGMPDTEEWQYGDYYCLYTKFYDAKNKEFATLRFYTILNPNQSKRTFSFGCYYPDKKQMYFFFKGKNVAQTRTQAVEVYQELKVLCDAEKDLCIPFAIKF